MRPSALLRRALRGEQVQCAAVQSWLRFPVYNKACAILELPFDQRRAKIEKLPSRLQDAVKREMIRVHEYRRAKR